MTNKINPHYIITPLGELHGPHWQAIMAGPDGHKIVCIALLLREMAAQCQAGGLICHPSGEPLTLLELAAALRVEAVWLAPVIAGPLSRAGLMTEDDNGGWRNTDPVLQRHCRRIAVAQSALPAPAVLPTLTLDATQPDESSESKKKREGRNRQRRHAYRQRHGCEPPEIIWQFASPPLVTPSNTYLTHPSQLPDNADESYALANRCIDQSTDNAVASLPNAAALPKSITEAISLLPVQLQHNAEQIATEMYMQYGESLISANYLHLSHKKRIEPAWLRTSIINDYAGASPDTAQQRANAEAAAQVAKKHAANNKAEEDQKLLDNIRRTAEEVLSNPDVIASEIRFLAGLNQ